MMIIMTDIITHYRVAGLEFSNVVGISGAGQQHGSVYWGRGASDILSSCQPDKFLHTQLSSAFSVQVSSKLFNNIINYIILTMV